ncbi:AhpC/TSA family protein [Novipirellula galeiformis]|uniref:AhpC/TSA family protein n=1 Tax=Novipirellula galeiformis TaxID=2528004 RepID=A0A5C6CH02_9BACT|nr:thioredoxin family protein [Novipirellula galeiformis]TWU23472.1 AhpC/TSA family protein [Novipirellula galeiformis]
MSHKPCPATITVWTLILAALTCFAAQTHAGEFNTTLNIGDDAPVWKNLPGTDDQLHSLSDLKAYDAIVVAFTCNSCPYAVDVEDRLIALQQQFAAQNVAVVAINVNKVEADLMPAMKQKAAEKKFKFLYLFDKSQQTAKDFGAKYTPEFFVLGNDRKIAYMGSFDDSPDGKNVTKPYVAGALEAVLAGNTPSLRETVPIGCRIRFERNLRKRSR